VVLLFLMLKNKRIAIMMHLIRYITLVLLVSCNLQNGDKINIDTAPSETSLFGKGIISTPLYERDFAISPEGDEIIYTLGDYTQKHRFLVCIKKDTQGWGKRKLMPFSGTYQDIEPFFSMDGKELYFASDRPMPGDTAAGDYNIWMTTRNGNKWSEPQSLDTIINGPGNEFYPAVSKKGNLYFTATRSHGVGAEDIFVSKKIKGIYQPPVPLDSAVNSKNYEYNAWVSPDEDIIIFGSYGREDGLGGGDMYISKKRNDGTWEQAQNMGAGINSTALDFCPFVDLKHGIFYFTSTRAPAFPRKITEVDTLVLKANAIQNGLGNIYHINQEKAGI